ncbi:MAG: hypothetical protein K6V73_12020 [Firmicutes bacterium]|nr:hypothetical protein [Bacillota bacterium]
MHPWPQAGAETRPAPSEAPAAPAPAAYPPLAPLRQLRLTYILAEGPDGLYVVDQHAAHERVRYEALEEAEGRGGEGVARQRLMPAAVVDLTPALVEALEAYAGEVALAGFRAEPFGGASVRIAEAPADVRLPGQVLRDLLSLLSDPGEAAPPAHRRRALMACRTAIRAGDALAPPEMARILDLLARCRFPATCPHGRPTVHRLPWDEVAAWFRRRA